MNAMSLFLIHSMLTSYDAVSVLRLCERVLPHQVGAMIDCHRNGYQFHTCRQAHCQNTPYQYVFISSLLLYTVLFVTKAGKDFTKELHKVFHLIRRSLKVLNAECIDCNSFHAQSHTDIKHLWYTMSNMSAWWYVVCYTSCSCRNPS